MWEETVMRDFDKIRVYYPGEVEVKLEAQAQITGDIAREEGRKDGYRQGLDDREGASDEEYKAGKQAGKQEVIKWVNDHCLNSGITEIFFYENYKYFPESDWQAFLKGGLNGRNTRKKAS